MQQAEKHQPRNRQIVAGSRFRCRCEKEILRTNSDTRVQKLPVYCRFCHTITILDVVGPESSNLISDRSLRA